MNVADKTFMVLHEFAGALPAYDTELEGFHRAFEPELLSLLNELPLEPHMKVIDLACGNGFYTRRLADRLDASGSVTGVDVSLTYLAGARKKATRGIGRASIDFVAASFDRLPFPDEAFDFAWCAQSLRSLPAEPVIVLEHLARVLRPGGIVAVLENDTLHEVVLPWPARLELAVREAELHALSIRGRDPSKYYVGRQLSAVLAAAGLEPLTITTRAITRRAPLGDAEETLLQSYLELLEHRVAPYLAAPVRDELRALVDPKSPGHILRQPDFTMTWLNVLAIARKRMSPYGDQRARAIRAFPPKK